MKTKINQKKGLHRMWSPKSLIFKTFILSAVILTGLQGTLMAQGTGYSRPSWRFGAAAGANFNFYQGSTQEINSGLIVPNAFHDGSGTGLYLGGLIEYHNPDSRLGIMFQAGYDNRKGAFDQIILLPCNCPADLKANPAYVTIEPSLRFAPFKGDLYIYGGPRIALNMEKSFVFQQGIDPTAPEQELNPEVEGDFSSMNKNLVSMQIGVGYDIQLSPLSKEMQWTLSPYVAVHPYIGQNPRSIESWNLTTVRVGAAIKLGRGKKNARPGAVTSTSPAVAVATDPTVDFSVISPSNLPVEYRVRETFPIRNYVFFDLNSTEIADRYVLLSKDQVKDFKEDRLEVFTPKKLTGRSDRQMTVYYNLLNILGDRMNRFPKTVVRLTGASMDSNADALAMAESVKKYLVNVFSIAPARITTEGRNKPRDPSEQPGGTKELDLLREGDRRVSIWSESPELVMQYQTGPDVPLAPVEIGGGAQAPVSSYVSFYAKGAEKAFTSWSLELKDEKGIIQKHGPYTKDNIAIPGKTILGSRASGDYVATMVGKTKTGSTMRLNAPVHMVLWTPSEREQGMRYSVIYEFNNSDAIAVYEKYLTEVVAPKVPANGLIIIRGHTDVIGEESHNQELSLERANNVRVILEKALTKAGRADFKFEVYGYGEDESLAPFNNTYPEERFYNRSVIIDLIPSKK